MSNNQIVRRYFRERSQQDIENGWRGVPRGIAEAQVLPNGEIALGFALCSEKDRFTRERGNMICRNRLESEMFKISPEDVDNDEAVIQEINNEGIEPMIDTINWVARIALIRSSSKEGISNNG